MRKLFTLLSVFALGESSADLPVEIYSALGSPLIAEIQLLPGESEKRVFSISPQDGSENRFEVEKITHRDALLLLSSSPVNQPILDLMLVSGDGGSERSITLFLDQVAPKSGATYIKQLLLERNSALQIDKRQLPKPTDGWFTPFTKHPVISRWSLFILLGGVAALLLMRWWRSAEPLPSTNRYGSSSSSSNDLPYGKKEFDESGNDDIWQEFYQGVEQLEEKIKKVDGEDNK